MRGFFIFRLNYLYPESYHRPNGMVHQIFTDASVKEMGKALPSMRAHAYKVGINAVGKMKRSFLHVEVAIDVGSVAIFDIKLCSEIVDCLFGSVGRFEIVRRVYHYKVQVAVETVGKIHYFGKRFFDLIGEV